MTYNDFLTDIMKLPQFGQVLGTKPKMTTFTHTTYETYFIHLRYMYVKIA